MTRTEWESYWGDIERAGTPEVIAEPKRELREGKAKCVLCHGVTALSIVWSVSFGEMPEQAEQVVVCRECRSYCDVCERYRVCDEVLKGVCDRCRIVSHIENDMYHRIPHYREELAQWDGADAYQGARLLNELKRAERELISKAATTGD